MSEPRTILITGSARGLGSAMARHLAASGSRLLLHYHTSEREALSLAESIREMGAEAIPIGANLADPQGREDLIAAVAGQTQQLDVLINNVGIFEETPLLEITPEQWDTTLAATCTAVFHLTRAFHPLLREAAPARVINLGDSGADRITARKQATDYHIAKLGVHVLTRSFARVLGPDGITVNQISPGFLENSIGEPESPLPLGRRGTFADVLAALDYLLSAEADYVSGANLVVSGGWNL